MSEKLNPNLERILRAEGSLVPSPIIAHDINDAWHGALREVMLRGYEYKVQRGSFEKTEIKRKELDLLWLIIRHPGARPLPPTVPNGMIPPTDDDTIEKYLKYLMTSEKQPNEQYTYGEFIEKQMWEVIRMFKEDGLETNQAYIAVGDAESIWQKDPPCLRGIDCRARYGRLHFVTYWRSWDIGAGFPTNLGGLQRMKEFMAEEIGINDGNLVAQSKGAHLYNYFWENALLITGLNIEEKCH